MRHNQGQNSKRARGRGRRNGSHNQTNFNRNTTFESNGPEGRLRGNAQQLFEKYTALAHDANSAGERISAEAFTQFADHYYRIHQTILQASEQQRKAHEERVQARRRDISDSESEDQLDSDSLRDSASKTPNEAKSDMYTGENVTENSETDSAEQARKPVQAKKAAARPRKTSAKAKADKDGQADEEAQDSSAEAVA
jgi:hypothetical protein